MSHTPGPWEATLFTIHDNNGVMLADACPQGGVRTTPELEANARLIATAPELLEALRDTIRHYAPKALECDEWALSGNSQTDAILRLARAAIAKAEKGE